MQGMTLSELFESQTSVSISPTDLLYIVDNTGTGTIGVSKAMTVQEFINYIFENGINVGNSESEFINIVAKIDPLSETNPTLRYNVTTGKWQFSNDGQIFSNIGSNDIYWDVRLGDQS